MSHDTPLYARAGEDVVCDAGHVVTRPTRDLRWADKIFGRDLEGMEHLRPPTPAEGCEGDVFPPCPCRAQWTWGGIMRFREGYRVIEEGAPRHLAVDEVPVWIRGAPDR